MRLDRYLANSGIGTRSEVKKILRENRVLVNGSPVRSGSVQIDENNDLVELDGSAVVYSRYVYFMLNKPAGYISATEGSVPTVMDLICEPYHDMFPCGRLDKDTEGLLLITNDGPLAHALLAPNHHVEKEYEVHLKEPYQPEYEEKLAAGIVIDDGVRCRPAKVWPADEKQCRIVIHEGKFHEIKRMFAALGNEVVYLKRLRMKNLMLDENLASGDYRPLAEDEIRNLRELMD